MSMRHNLITGVRHDRYTYPVRHWEDLERFAIGDEHDPRGLFRLADDKWEAWRYAEAGRPTTAGAYRLNFGGLSSFLKIYSKWYCYELLTSGEGALRAGAKNIPYSLLRADRFIIERGFTSIDDLASQVIFDELWAAQIIHPKVEGQTRWTHAAVCIQERTRAFWRRLRLHFGAPHVVPPVYPHIRKRPVGYADDESRLIPDPVIKQLTNKLALHRRKVEILNRYHHLRLCVLILSICIGRRIEELLSAPRGRGPAGPLCRAPARGGSHRGSLWFQFKPNKGGPASQVFISSEWEEIATYCVRELAKYSDEIRQDALPEERELLILVSTSNMTSGQKAALAPAGAPPLPAQGCSPACSTVPATGLSDPSFRSWLNDVNKHGKVLYEGVMKKWNITADGREGGPIYIFRPTNARHTRQSALASNPQIPLHARRYDLNHHDSDGQFAYQHRLRENNDALLEKIKEGKFVGPGAEWLEEVLGDGAAQGFSRGRPSPMSTRWLTLVKNSPLFLQRNRVPGGICVLPQGPGGCPEFKNCTGAREGGCPCFMVDADDPRMLNELSVQAREERRLQRESAGSGRVVQAEKRETQARRTEDLRDEALRRSSAKTLEMLRRFETEIERKGLWAEE